MEKEKTIKDKKIILLFIIVILCLTLVVIFLRMTFQNSQLNMDEEETFFGVAEEESFFDDFEIKGDKVNIYCELTIVNRADEKISAKPYIILEEDKRNGLLKEAKLYAYDQEGKIQTINLNPGEKIHARCCFRGNYGGYPEKANRLLPEVHFERQPWRQDD